MRNILSLAVLGMLALSACTPAEEKQACAIDAAAVPVATADAKVGAVLDPTIAPDVAAATVLDVPVHAGVQALCAPVLAAPSN